MDTQEDTYLWGVKRTQRRVVKLAGRGSPSMVAGYCRAGWQGSSSRGLSSRKSCLSSLFLNAVQNQRSICLTSALCDTQPPEQCLQDNMQFSVCIRAVRHTSEMRERTKGFFKQAGLPMKTTMKVMMSSTCRPSSDLGECCPTYSISSHKSSTKYSCRHSVSPPSGRCAEPIAVTKQDSISSHKSSRKYSCRHIQQQLTQVIHKLLLQTHTASAHTSCPQTTPADTVLWAAWYNTGLLIILTLKGMVFSFLFRHSASPSSGLCAEQRFP